MKTNDIIVSINFRYGCSLYKPCFTLKLKERKKKKNLMYVLSQYLAQRGINIYTLYIEELVL